MSLIDDFIESTEPSSSQRYANPYSANSLSHGFDHVDPIMLETGYISTGFAQDDARIFSLDPVQFPFPDPLVAMAVSNNVLAMALETNHVLRIDLQQAHEVEDIEIPRKPGEGRIYKIFFDPTGRHLIVTTEHGENFYLYERWKKAKQLARLKGVIIESIAWNPLTSTSDPSTLPILLGTRTGLIYETTLEPTDDFFRREEKYLKQVYSIHELGMPITGLHFEQFPASPRKYFVVATTPTRIYQFVGTAVGIAGGGAGGVTGEEGRAVFEGLFAKYDVNPGFQELPGDLTHSELHFFSKYQDLHQRGVAQTFAWLTGPGIYHGNLVFGSGDSVIDSTHLLPYPATASDTDPSAVVVSEVPLSIALTEFHFVLLYKDRVRAINQLNDQIVYEEMIPLAAGKEVRRLTIDSVKNTFWIYTNSSIHELLVTREDRDVWRLYLDGKHYDTALQYCKDPAQRDRVFTTQANDYFAQGRYQLSAKYFADSTVPFEEVALKFVEREERDALRKYLLSRLEKLKKADLTQKYIIATWLVEIFLSRINELEDLATSSTPSDGSVPSADAGATANDHQLRQRELEDEFRVFLEAYHGYLHRETTYKLISSHGRTDELLHYATLIGDYEKVIWHWIEEKNWKEALKVLSKQVGREHSVFFFFFSLFPFNVKRRDLLKDHGADVTRQLQRQITFETISP
ncbi:Pep3/Vps18/deep orange family-domain-containing protein [Jimgerdemannia flammicorona]|uniref:Pep3/Vps18/deep orange family-domain-containing protein n=1 Tax=Jimgerdemannia flammicorona TaxID=994334 RepID=A0A433DEA3_9FUNG|nr:Pep3/Vps18/deep orange family-domain-containing protein [Jimgerdemannia flammicorona]